MRAIRPNQRRTPLWIKLLLLVGLLIVGGAGTVATLGAMKIIDLGRLAFWNKPRTYPPDWVAVPVSAKPIPAYTAVTRDYLLNPATGEELTIRISPEKAHEYAMKGIILNAEKVRGRVTAREHGALYFFKESDFLPEGSRPGVAGGTPVGKRAITLDASKLKGAHDLREGDHVDLLASVPVDMPGAEHAANRMGTAVVSSPEVALLPKRGYVRALVQDGVVVTPVRVRNAPISSSSLTQGMTTRTIPVQEIVIAVEPREAAPLFEAIDLQYEIICLARSGRTDAVVEKPTAEKPAVDKSAAAKQTVDASKRTVADVTPGLDPAEHMNCIDVMIGGKRQLMVFGSPGSSPRVAAQDNGPAAAEPELPAADGNEQQSQRQSP